MKKEDELYVDKVTTKTHYVNNRELFETMVDYRKEYLQSLELGLERPPMPVKVAEACMQIATRMSRMHNFLNYSFRDEMIADAILQLAVKFHLFDPSVSENPFAFYSQICWNTFIGRIKTEQNQASTRAAMVNELCTDEFLTTLEADVEGTNQFVEFLRDNQIFVDYFKQRKDGHIPKQHASLVHRNLTAPKRKDDTTKIVNNKPIDLFEL